MKRHGLVLLLWLGMLTGAARAQQLESVERSGTFAVAAANARQKTRFGDAVPPLKRALTLLRIRYRSTNLQGRAVTLSGLLAMPEGGATRGLIVWHHGTFSERALSPSLFKPGVRASEIELALLAFGSGGYGIAIPDYLGYGVDKGAHPYPLSEVNSRSALDFVAPCRAAAARLQIPLAAPLWVGGYSEGGAVAMWTARRLEERGQSARGAALLSGPYDLSGATRESLLSPAPNFATFVARLYLLAFTGYSLAKGSGAPLGDFFQPAMAREIGRAFGSGASDQDIITRLAAAAILTGAGNRVQNVLTPRFYRAVSTLDARNSVVAALRRNDAFRWTPRRTPLALWALESDELVAAKNTRIALAEFRRRGVTSRLARAEIVQSASINHITGFATALVFARRFFDGGFAGVPGAR